MSPADKESIRAFCFVCDGEDMRWSEERTVEAVAALTRRYEGALVAELHKALTGVASPTADKAVLREIIAAVREDRDVALSRAWKAEHKLVEYNAALARESVAVELGKMRVLAETLRRELDKEKATTESLSKRLHDRARKELLETAALLMGGNEGAQAKIWAASDIGDADAPAFVRGAQALIAAVDAALVPK